MGDLFKLVMLKLNLDGKLIVGRYPELYKS